MNDSDVQSDDHLFKIAEAHGRGAKDNHERNNSPSLKAKVSVPIDNRNQLSTPVMIAAIICFFVAGIIGGLAIGIANTANDKAGQARMEARLAQEDLIMLRAAVRAAGIHAETASDHD